MIIVPVKPVDSTDPELLPIRMIIEDRMDIIALYLRVLRHVSARGGMGETLRWEDSDTSPIYIAKHASGTEFANEVNPLPALLIKIGGYRTNEMFLSQSMVNTHQEGSSRLSDLSPSIRISVRGRSEPETYRLSDILSKHLDTLRPAILASALNLEFMSGITTGEVYHLNDTSGSPYVWECNLDFSVSVNRYMMTAMYPAISPDPRKNKGLFLGTAGDQSKEDPNSTRPMFAYSDFVLKAGTPEDGYPYTVSTQMIFDEQGADTVLKKSNVSAAFEVSADLAFGTVPAGHSTEIREVTVALASPGRGDFEMVFPDGVSPDIPGIALDSEGILRFTLEK